MHHHFLHTHALLSIFISNVAPLFTQMYLCLSLAVSPRSLFFPLPAYCSFQQKVLRLWLLPTNWGGFQFPSLNPKALPHSLSKFVLGEMCSVGLRIQPLSHSRLAQHSTSFLPHQPNSFVVKRLITYSHATYVFVSTALGGFALE